MEMEEDCLKQILRNAAMIMRAGGLVRGARRDGTGAHCLLGAISDAIPVTPCAASLPIDGEKIVQEAAKIVAEALPLAGPFDRDPYNWMESGEEINNRAAFRCAWWSNQIATDAEQVALKLEEAAAL